MRVCCVKSSRINLAVTLPLVSPAPKVNNESLRVFRKMLTPRGRVICLEGRPHQTCCWCCGKCSQWSKPLHGGGLAQALVKAGGFEIQEESRSLDFQMGQNSSWWDSYHKSREASCRLIIHAVGLRWASMYSQECVDKLKRAIMNILRYVNNKNSLNIETVAIPALSSWDFPVPFESVYRDHCANYQIVFPKRANCQ